MLDIAPPMLSPLAEPRLDRAEALRLATSPDFLALALRAGKATTRRFGRERYAISAAYVTCGADATVTFAGEPLPELQRSPRIPTVAEITRREMVPAVGEWHVLTGADAGLPFTAYEQMARDLRRFASESVIVGFTATDIQLFSAIYHLPVNEILRRLHAAGLDMLSGRDLRLGATAPDAVLLDEWLNLHREAHALGLASAVMLPCEAQASWADRIDFLFRLRDLHFATGGVARIELMPAHGHSVDALEQLRALGMCRLICPDAPHIVADARTLGEQHALTALTCGADTVLGAPEALAGIDARCAELDLRCERR